MTKKTYKIPKFKSDAEAAAFWDSHDSTKYLAQTKTAYLEFPKPRHKVVLDLGEKQWNKLQHIAHIRKTSFNHLLEKIVSESLVSAH